jgi:hypothetical protein
MKAKIYDLVKSLLQEDVSLRDNDKLLVWKVWEMQGVAQKSYLTKDQFMLNAESIETIGRTRRMIQQSHPELDASHQAKVGRRKRFADKGTFVFRERIPVFDNVNNTVHYEE